jgi:tRNA(Leu) C34 or U34 (ribose-2'-O)-methylase TrmL
MTPERFQVLKATLTQRQPDLTVLTADIHKTHNISAVLRTCVATGIFQMQAVSPGGETRRDHMVSGGSRRWVDIKIHGNLKNAVHALRNDGWLLAAAHPCQRARDYREIDYTRKIAILLGSELEGLTPPTVETADETIGSRWRVWSDRSTSPSQPRSFSMRPNVNVERRGCLRNHDSAARRLKRRYSSGLIRRSPSAAKSGVGPILS